MHTEYTRKRTNEPYLIGITQVTAQIRLQKDAGASSFHHVPQSPMRTRMHWQGDPIINACVVSAPIQCNACEENEANGQDNMPLDWSETRRTKFAAY